MKWTLETRRKLAKMVREKALAIQRCEFSKSKPATFSKIVDLADKKVLELLAPLGFEKANKDWEHESNEDVMIFKPSKTHLWFTTIQGRVVKISKENAEKVLVLGALE